MDSEGFVRIGDLLKNLRKRYDIDECFIREVVEKSDRRRFQIVSDKIRAIYGHTIDVGIKFPVDERIRPLYHGTTMQLASIILNEGLKPMKRRWVHLSATPEIARDVGKRRILNPIILVIDARKTRQEGVKFHKATNQVYLSEEVPSKFIKILNDTHES
jgi:putative RNA 2'-phosphotransferase